MWGFRPRTHSEETAPGDRDDDRQPETAITGSTNKFLAPILQFLAVGRCRNDLVNLLSRSTSSKIAHFGIGI